MIAGLKWLLVFTALTCALCAENQPPSQISQGYLALLSHEERESLAFFQEVDTLALDAEILSLTAFGQAIAYDRLGMHEERAVALQRMKEFWQTAIMNAPLSDSAPLSLEECEQAKLFLEELSSLAASPSLQESLDEWTTTLFQQASRPGIQTRTRFWKNMGNIAQKVLRWILVIKETCEFVADLSHTITEGDNP